MNWVSDLVKYLPKSKIFAFAVFNSAAILFFGPHFWPSQLPDLAGAWKLAAGAALVYSGTYLVSWLVGWLWQRAIGLKDWVIHFYHSGELTGDDWHFLMLVAQNPYETLNVMFQFHGLIAFEKKQLGKRLCRTGLVCMSPNDDAIFSLTNRGKKQVDKFIKSIKSDAAHPHNAP